MWLYVAVAALVALAAVRLARWLLTPVPIAGIPHNFQGKGKVPLFGDSPEFNKFAAEAGLHEAYYEEMYRRHGRISQVLVPAGLSMVLVNDVAATHEILSTRTPSDFERDWEVTAPGLTGVLRTGSLGLQTNEMHRLHRKATAQALSPSYLARYVPRMTRVLEELITLWTLEAKRADGKPFSAESDCVCLTSDIASAILFNHNYGETKGAIEVVKNLDPSDIRVNSRGGVEELPYQHSKLYNGVQVLMDAIGTATFCGAPRLYHFFDQLRPSRRRADRDVRAYLAEQMIAARLTVNEREQWGAIETEEGGSLVEQMAEKEGTSKGLRLELNEVVDELLVMSAAAAETAAFSCMWMLKQLTRQPQAQRLLHDYLVERLAPLKERMPTYEDLSTDRVPLLDAYVHELLRTSRLIGGVTRRAVRDTHVLGHFIPRGTWVLLSPCPSRLETGPAGGWDDHQVRQGRGCGYWRKPEAFDPSRWLDSDGNFDIHAGPTITFSAGPRGCWGQRIALLELKAILACWSMSFYFDSVPEALDTRKAYLNIVIKPAETYIRPRPWSEVPIKA